MKKISLFFILLLAIASFAQNTVPGHDWVETGQMLRYPSNRFFTAVGIGANEATARENAIVEVRRQISASIDSRTLLTEVQITENNRTTTTSQFDQTHIMAVAGNVEGVQIIATEAREGNFFAFAALEKERFISHQRMKITELRNALIEANKQAQNAEKDGNIALALQIYNSTFDKISAIEAERALLSAATTLNTADGVPISRSQISANIARLAASLRITAASEESQRVFIEDVAELEFTVLVKSDGNEAENIRVLFFDANERRVATALTNHEGLAHFMLGDSAPTARGTHRFTAKIDWNGETIGEARFSYTVQTRELSARISVSVSNDLRNGRAEIERAVLQMFSEHGITNSATSCARITATVSDTPGETVQGVSAARTFVRSTAEVLISVSDQRGTTVFSAGANQLGMANQRTGAVADGVRKMRLGANLSPMQEAIRAVLDGCQ
ncbi:MAG: LPP20 family lipoprotein [Chitinivibrionia bacterium]|nr:LPP20 family lipoprotein [Chitinivibrionia bacterium]